MSAETTNEPSAVHLASKRGFIREVRGTLGAQASAALLSGLVVIIAARTLGAADQGRAASLIALGAAPAGLLGGGLLGSIVRHGARRQTDRLVGSASLAGLVTAAAAAGLTGMSLLFFASEEVPSSASLASLSLAFVIPLDLAVAGLLRAEGRMRVVALIDAAESLAVLLTVVLLAASGRLSVSSTVWGYVGGTVISLVATASIARSTGCVRVERPSSAAVRELGSFAAPLVLGSGLQMGFFRLDVAAIRLVLGESQAGLYSVAARLAEPALLVPGAVSAVVTSRSAAIDVRALRRTTPRIFWGALCASVLPVVVLALVASPLVRIIFGDAFAQAAGLVGLVAGSRALLGASLVLTEDINQRGRPWVPVVVSALTMTTGALALLTLAEGRSLHIAAGLVLAVALSLVVATVFAWVRTSSASIREFVLAGRLRTLRSMLADSLGKTGS